MAIRRVILVLLVALVSIVTLLWHFGGQERLTKTFKTISKPFEDPDFGDVTMRDEVVRGPVLGYFVGLDAVIVIAIGAAIVAGVTMLATRRRVLRASNETGVGE